MRTHTYYSWKNCPIVITLKRPSVKIDHRCAKQQESKNFKKIPKIALVEVWIGKLLKTSLDFYFRRNQRFFDLMQIYANSRGFRLLHLKISKKSRKDGIEKFFYITEVKDVATFLFTFWNIYCVLEHFIEFLKWTILRHRKTFITTRKKTHIGTSILTKWLL